MTEIKNENPLLEVKDLSVYYVSKEIGTCKAVNEVSFTVNKGETIGLVGETGAGKTTIAYSILQLLQTPPGKVVNGEIIFNGKNLLDLSERDMQKIRGKEISMIFQDPMTALNPIETVGDQIREVILLHNKITPVEAKVKAQEMMEMVGIPGERYDEYAHEFSGGMKQRIVIAMALACSPELLIADEPTTALDVTIQAQVLDMMNDLREKYDTSVILITHDLGVVAEMCSRVAVIYAGQVVEMGDKYQVFNNTRHPYTIGLFDSLPSVNTNQKRLKPIKGLMPDPARLPDGCKFAERCDHCCDACRSHEIPMREIEPGHFVRCDFAENFRRNNS
ncbi:MAG: ABC transporter ATP-binding protein [Solobacterium sp.]|nr:ABC transporter ATP-binding protein [Solobacterium sp.]